MDSLPIPVPLVPFSARVGSVVLIAAGILYYSTVGMVSAPVGGAGDGTGTGTAGLTVSHVLGYALLAWSLAYADADRPSPEAVAWRRAAFVIVATGSYGLLLEVVQLGFAQRVFAPVDVVSNLLGAATVLGWYVIEPHLKFIPIGSGQSD